MFKGSDDSDAETEETSITASSPSRRASENSGGCDCDDGSEEGSSLSRSAAAEEEGEEEEEKRLRPRRYETSMTPEPDAYGQYHPLETQELISERLTALAEELEHIPGEEKVGWTMAEDRCPDLVGDRHRIMFLRCEDFQPDRAASRLVTYWDKRVELFGEDRAFLPLTLDGALKDDIDALLFGFVRTNGRMVDASGRRVLFMDPSVLDGRAYDRTSMNRATWYAVHAALEDDTTQRRGVAMILYPLRARVGQFDQKLIRADVENMRGCIPVRVGAFFVCHPPLFAHMILPTIKVLLGRKLRSRFHVFSGKKKTVLEKLSKFGIAKKNVPKELGGYLVLDQDLWLADRRVTRG